MIRKHLTFANHGLVLNRDPMTATGVTFGPGTPIDSVSQLPDHAVELHRFTSDHGAVAFMEGYALAGGSNDVVMDFAPGHGMHRNTTVVVARLSEPRPHGATLEDCIPLFDHPPPGHVIASIAETTRRSQEHVRQNYEAAEADSAPLRKHLADAGWSSDRFGSGFVQASKGETGGIFSWKDAAGPIEYEESVTKITEGTLDISTRLRSLIRASGFDIDDDGIEVRLTVPNQDAVPPALQRIEQLAIDIDKDRKAAWHEDFCERYKLTPARRRLLEAAEENDGIGTYRHRGHMRGTLRGKDVPAAELHQLERRGWLSSSGNRFRITDEGREALREALPRPAR